MAQDYSAFLKLMNPQAPQPMMTPIPQPSQAPVRTMVNVPSIDETQANQAAMQAQAANPQIGTMRAPVVSTQTRGPMPMSSDEVEMNEAFKQLVQSRQSGISQMEEELAQAKERRAALDGQVSQMDLSGLMAFSDALTGSKLAQSYKPSTDRQDMDAMVQKLGDSVRKDRDGLGADHLQYLKDRQVMRMQKSSLDMQKQDRFMASQKLKMEDKMRGDLAKPADAYNTAQASLGTLESAVQSGDLAQIRATMSQFARQIGGEKGALSEGDVSRAMADTLENRIAEMQRYFDMGGQVDPKVQANLQQLISSSKSYAARAYEHRLNRQKEAYNLPGGAYQPYMQPGQWGSAMFDAYSKEAQSAVRSNPGQTQTGQVKTPPPGLTREQFQAWKAQNKG